LAADIETSRQAVHSWLKSGHASSVPNADFTLRLLAWVAAKEAEQQQSPASAVTPARPKTRMKGKTSEESPDQTGKKT
jgi:hypothetical protein